MDKEILLFPHNEEGHAKLKDALIYNQMVSINHATGTGKSFIILKYLYENRKKRILYLSPSYPINDQLVEEHMKDLGIDISEFEKFDTCIYSNFGKYNIEEVAANYDIIVLDEYHRCGAKVWGRAINELLDLLKRKYPNVKVIGTTATEIRYLDNEKNMNNILFDGVCASTLTLADAILKGILPAPTYISLFGNLFSVLTELENLINEKVIFNVNRRKMLDDVKFIQSLFVDILKNDDNINKYLSGDGKHLVFSSNIESIDDDINFIKMNFFRNRSINTFIVHSRNSKIRNKIILDKFRKAKYGVNILFSVNILNEGVHVKGIRSVFMRRETKSPIIYFQQLGRLLSYSSKDNELVVFDLVDNLKNHNVIYELYKEVVDKAKKLMIENPDKKEFYEGIIAKFKILDKAAVIYGKIDEIREILEINNLIALRLDTAISILEGKIVANEVEILQAKIFVFQYYDYITISMFSRLKKLDIDKPKIFDLSENEFIKLLDDNKNIYEKNNSYIKSLEKEILMFIKTKKRVPSFFSNVFEEKTMAIDMNNNFSKFSSDTLELVFNVIREDNNLSIIEKFNYGGDMSFCDEEATYKFIDFALSLEMKISDNFINLLKKIDNNKALGYLEKMGAIGCKDDTEIKIETSDNFILIKENNDIYYKKEFSKVMIKYSSLVDEKGIDYVLEKLYIDLSDFMDHVKMLPKYYNSKMYDDSMSVYFNKERELYCGMIIFYSQLKDRGYIDRIYDKFNKVREETEKGKKNVLLQKFIAFVLCDFNNMSYEQLKLFDNYNVVKEYNKLNGILGEEDKRILENYFTLYKSKYNDLVLAYINFLYTYNRYPLLESCDNEEIKLYYFFNNKTSYLSSEDKKKIKDAVNGIGRKKILYNTHIALDSFEKVIKLSSNNIRKKAKN